MVQIGRANHFAPNDFVRQNNHSKTGCAVSRSPPEDAFRTTFATQKVVVKSVAKVFAAAVRVYVRGKRVDKLLRLRDNENAFVDSIQIL